MRLLDAVAAEKSRAVYGAARPQNCKMTLAMARMTQYTCAAALLSCSALIALAQEEPAAPKPDSQATITSPAADDEIKIIAVGDTMLGSALPDESSLPPNDGADLLQEVTPILQQGDIVFGNLEGPMVDTGTTKKCRPNGSTCFAFRVPTRYGQYLKKAGFTVMGLANNHAMDFGLAGRASSRAVLDSLGIAHSGEVGDIAHLVVKGKRISLIAFATYPSSYNFLDLDSALDTIRQERLLSDLVIVSFHGGAEGAIHQHVPYGNEDFLGEDRGDLRLFTHAAIDAGAALVFGHGPHVVRGMEIYCGHLIAYSLGNFATYGPFNLKNENGLSLILEARIGMDGLFRGAKAYPIQQVKPGGPHLDPAMSILPILKGLSEYDFPDSHVGVNTNGDIEAGPVAPGICGVERQYVRDLFHPEPCGVFRFGACLDASCRLESAPGREN